jgi:hypothetical protein
MTAMTIEYFRLDNLQGIKNVFNLSTKRIFHSSKNKNWRGKVVLGSWLFILAKNSEKTF